MYKVRIIATLGPSTNGKERDMAREGMDMARIVLGHGNRAEHAQLIGKIDRMRANGSQLDIIADLCGLKMRIGELENPPIRIEEGKELVITMDDIVGNTSAMSVNYKGLAEQVVLNKAKTILIAGVERLIELQVIDATKQKIKCRVVKGASLRGRKGIYVPGIELDLPSLTDRDQKDLKFVAEQKNKIQYVAISFVRRALTIKHVRQILWDYNAGHIKIIAKIETKDILEKSDELKRVVKAADLIMVGRTDLGINIGLRALPAAQAFIADICKKANKPFIIASRLLGSMTTNDNEPSKAEILDVYTGCQQGAWGFMFSVETGVGRYPVEAIKELKKILANYSTTWM